MNTDNTNIKAEKKFIIFDQKDRAYAIQTGKTAQKALEAYVGAHPTSSAESYCVYKVEKPLKFTVSRVVTKKADTLYLYDTAEERTAEQLGITEEEYDNLCEKSESAAQAEGVVSTSTGIRVYAL